MPLLSIKVPAFLRDELPEDIDDQVKQIGGYSEGNLHITLAILDYNPDNAKLVTALTKGLEEALRGKIPGKIILDYPQRINNFYLGAPVNKAINTKLAEIFVVIQKLVAELRAQFGEKEIFLQNWPEFKAHLSFCGQCPEMPILPDTNAIYDNEFIPTSVILRDSDTVLYELQNVAANREDLQKEADNLFEQAQTNALSLKKNNNHEVSFYTIQKQYLAAESIYKNLDQLEKRISCLINLGQLNTFFWEQRNKDEFFNKDPNKYAYRLRTADYAITICRALKSVGINGTTISEKVLKDIELYLEQVSKFLHAASRDQNYKTTLVELKLDDAQAIIDTGLNRVKKLLGAEIESNNCLVM